MDSARMKANTAVDYRRRVCQAMNLISRNLDRDLPLVEIAAAAAFSKYHFHRIFRAVVGETVAAFTRRLRLEQAAGRLLGRPREDITTTAMACGFSSSQNFAKSFRRQFGMTPTAFRMRKLGNKPRNLENALSLRTVYHPDTAFTNQSTDERSSIMMGAEVKEMPDYHVAYVRKMGPYGQEVCEQAFGELSRWAGPKGFMGTGVMLSLAWDSPEITPPEKCRLDACISVPPGTRPDSPVGLQTIDGGPYAVCHFEIGSDGFKQAWEEAFAWLVRSGHECAHKPCYERYHNDAADHPEGKWVVDICIPLESSS